NGRAPEGRGVTLGIWTPAPYAPVSVEAAAYRRMAHHLGAAHRCRRRLRDALPPGAAPKPAVGAEAIFNAELRILHAEGRAREPLARARLARAASVRERTRARRGEAVLML